MRIIQLTPGTGNFYCGSCLRDTALVRGLRARGHDALMVPLYLPHVTDEEPTGDSCPIFLSGINVYLEQKIPFFRYMPDWLDRALSSPKLLGRVARFAGMTSAKALGESTVSMLRGADGCQAGELDRLVGWLRSQPPPDVICISNSLLIGLAKPLKQRLGVPVVCTLQGEDSFLDGLPEPYRQQSWQLLSGRCPDVDRFIAVSQYFAELMTRRLSLDPARVSVIYPGINLDEFAPAENPPQPPAIGFLARMSAAKGLATLADAFIELKKRSRVAGLRLRIAGSKTDADEKFVEQLRAKLAAANAGDSVDFLPNIDLRQKQEFLRSLTVLSVPATYGEAFGLYILEALASGVPVVQPHHAAFPEVLAQTGGGILCNPYDPVSLADALESLLLNPAEARRLGAAGRKAVQERFGAEIMAAKVEAVFAEVVQRIR